MAVTISGKVAGMRIFNAKPVVESAAGAIWHFPRVNCRNIAAPLIQSVSPLVRDGRNTPSGTVFVPRPS
jgi:hypothetical protein